MAPFFVAFPRPVPGLAGLDLTAVCFSDDLSPVSLATAEGRDGPGNGVELLVLEDDFFFFFFFLFVFFFFFASSPDDFAADDGAPAPGGFAAAVDCAPAPGGFAAADDCAPAPGGIMIFSALTNTFVVQIKGTSLRIPL
jgi:hypothetical protein